MSEASSWLFSRVEARSAGGAVAAKDRAAAVAGADVLRRGGNAVDAAVVTALVSGVTEPYMSGLGGGGFMLVRLASGQTRVIDYHMRAPAAARPEMFRLAGGAAAGLFGWPRVEGDVNLHGPLSVAVPGTVAGLALALRRFGTISWREACEPAIRLAEEGVPVPWWLTFRTAADAALLRRHGAGEVFLPGGLPPAPHTDEQPSTFRQPALARTLRRLAERGPEEFYAGEIAAELVDDLQAAGGILTPADLAAYRPREVEPLVVGLRRARVLCVPGPAGGATVAQILGMLDAAGAMAPDPLDPANLHRLIDVSRLAFADRFAYLGDPEATTVPFGRLLDPEYLRERAGQVRDDRALRADEVRPGLGPAAGSGGPDGSTTHLSAVDAAGNAVSCTQTLLSIFGSRVLSPRTGVLLNNGMMWFDPRPGGPNQVRSGARPLCNMSPLLIEHGDGGISSVGASGGRRILCCVSQLAQRMVDHRLGPQAAIECPRLDASGPVVLIDSRVPAPALRRLKELGHRLSEREPAIEPRFFASPVAVSRAPDGTVRGGADPLYPAWAQAVER